jgi:succinate dehydrogenase assembly factor 2
MLRQLSKLRIALQPVRAVKTTTHLAQQDQFMENGHEHYAKKNESREVKAKRLLWQSRKRGISENDLLLSTWFKKSEPTLSDEDLDVYCSLINGNVNEWDLFYWMAGTKPVPEEWDNSVMHSLQKHCSNDKREERFFQPATENSKSV